MNAVESKFDSLPLPYIAALAGFVAAICPMAAMSAVAIASWGLQDWVFGLVFLVPASFASVVVMILTGVPLLFLIRLSGMTSRWLYVAGTSIIIGGSYLLLFLSESRVYIFLPLVPIAAAPSGLFLHHLAQPRRSVPPVDDRDALIVATWIAAWIFFVAFMSHTPESSYDPWRRRFEIAGLAWSSGLPAFLLCGFAAGLARLWSMRVGLVVASLAWLIPVLSVVGIYLTPLGPEKFHFAVGDRAFDIDWHLNPRAAFRANGFCFDTSSLELYAGSRRRPLNQEICVTKIDGPLAATIPSTPGERRWIEAGLICEEVLVRARAGRVCSAADAAGQTEALIECSPGDCFHRFDDHGLRYALYWNPEDFAAWHALQELALRLVTEVGRSRA